MINPYLPATPEEPSLDDLYSKYMEAQQALDTENSNFKSLLEGIVKQPMTKPDKSELYFRLAAAFGSPTKTGHFTESLGRAAETVSAYEREQREAEDASRLRQNEAQIQLGKLGVESARTRLSELRPLLIEQMKQRDEGYKPLSEAGKIASDAGLRPGTPEYTQFVNDYVKDKREEASAFKSANLAVARGRLGLAQEQAEMLTPTEMNMVSDARTAVSAADNTINALTQALELADKAFTGSASDRARYAAMREVSPNHPKVLATEQLEQLLTKSALDSMKATFGGNPTEGERAILLTTQGLNASSAGSRRQQIETALNMTKAQKERKERELDEIRSGGYRMRKPK